jgi:purine-binding chemotaxis protein CheW
MDLVEIRKKAKSRKKKAQTPVSRKKNKEPTPGGPEGDVQPVPADAPPDHLSSSEGGSAAPEREEPSPTPEGKPAVVDQPEGGDPDVENLSGLERVLLRQHRDEEGDEEEEQLKVLTFNLGQEEYALNIMDIKEIIRPGEVTEVPRTPDYIQGILSLRGTIIPVFDVNGRLGLSTGESQSENRIVVVKWQEHLFGLLVDRVVQVMNIPLDRIDPPPEILGGVEGEFLRGVGKVDDRLIILLNLGRILGTEEPGQVSSPQLPPGSDN